MLKQAMIFAAFVSGVFCSSHLNAQSATQDGNNLIIRARNGASQRFVIRPGQSRNSSGQIQSIVVAMPNGSQQSFSMNTVNNIVFLGGTGNDTCEIVPNASGLTLAAARRSWTNLSPLEIEMFGSGGNDTLTGGDTDDALFGGSGIDTLDAGSKGEDGIMGGSNGDRFHVYYHWGTLGGYPYAVIHSTFPDDFNSASGDRLVYHYELYFTPRFRFRF